LNIEHLLTGMSEEKREALQLSHDYLMPNRVETWLAAGVPLVIGRREGYRIWDMDGLELQDFHLNGGVYNLGHRHPVILNALEEGLKHLDAGNHHFPSLTRGRLARALADNTPGALHYSVLTPSASEANDMAIKTARQATGRSKIVAFDFAYHGNSGLSGAVGNDDSARFFGSAFDEEMIRIPFNDLAALKKALQGRDVALFLAEVIPATFGFAMPDPDFYRSAKLLCEESGTLFGVDEVQTGLGRSGKLWAIEHYNVEPDMLVTGKGLGGGIYPMGALVMTEEVGGWLKNQGWGYVSSFGGAEIGCHVALAALELTTSEETRQAVNDNASYMRAGLDDIAHRYPHLQEIRQLGVIFSLGFAGENSAMAMSAALYSEGLWAMFASYDRRFLQLKLGLLVDRPYIDEAMEKLETAIHKVSKA
jgi:putrescine aminotransferase